MGKFLKKPKSRQVSHDLLAKVWPNLKYYVMVHITAVTVRGIKHQGFTVVWGSPVLLRVSPFLQANSNLIANL